MGSLLQGFRPKERILALAVALAVVGACTADLVVSLSRASEKAAGAEAKGMASNGGRIILLTPSDMAQLRRAANGAMNKPPDPLPVVHVEGVLPTTAEYRRANESKRDWTRISELAAAFAATNERRYAERAGQYLTAWLDTYRISGNPIDETGLSEWLLADHLIGPTLEAGLRARLRNFACTMSQRYLQPQPANRKTSTNNWQSHRVKLAVMGALVCGDNERIAVAMAAFKEQITRNLRPNGESIDFDERDAIHYVVYSIEPLLEAALFAQHDGQALFGVAGPEGQSLTRTLAWLEPYARGEKTHEEFAHSTVRFDAERAAAGVSGFKGPFSAERASLAFWLASRLDQRWEETSRHIGLPPTNRRAPWELLQ
ncbi:alginate lyase family protein [Propionivibrio soli]|uniref:alginate lyase family protein n=1 Tax=Propionivibrio soli TaxID=2976531 RepID=UPI0021E6ED46|nr:alginate lyase family protein [Propionivibrio soli]